MSLPGKSLESTGNGGREERRNPAGMLYRVGDETGELELVGTKESDDSQPDFLDVEQT